MHGPCWVCVPITGLSSEVFTSAIPVSKPALTVKYGKRMLVEQGTTVKTAALIGLFRKRGIGAEVIGTAQSVVLIGPNAPVTPPPGGTVRPGRLSVVLGV